MGKEVFKEIPNYKGNYYISNYGRVYSVKRKKFLREIDNNNGYKRIGINGKLLYIHKLVALVFVPNPNNFSEINHKDENKSNNNSCNLEWCDHKYNMNYGTQRARAATKRKKKIKQILNDVEIATFESIKEANLLTGISGGNICSVLKGNRPFAGGYKWLYYE